MLECISTGRQIHPSPKKIGKESVSQKKVLTTISISDLFGINCATGMSALMRKELLDNKGGFEAFGCYLAEDFFFAQAVQVLSLMIIMFYSVLATILVGGIMVARRTNANCRILLNH